MPLVIRKRLLAAAATVPPYPGRRPCETTALVASVCIAVAGVSLGAVLATIG